MNQRYVSTPREILVKMCRVPITEGVGLLDALTDARAVGGSVRVGAARVLESSADRRSEAHPRLHQILCPEKFWNLHVKLT